jgi:hypothetical protein
MSVSPSIVPVEDDVYFVEVDLGHWGHVWPEADSTATDLETMLTDMLAGQHNNPIRVVAFNVGEGWSRDYTAASIWTARTSRKAFGTLSKSMRDHVS